MTLQRVQVAADRGYWASAAAAVLHFAAEHGCPPRRLHGITWLTAHGAHATAARAAVAAAAGTAIVPPRVQPLAAWVGTPLAAGFAATLEVYGALRDSDWVKQSFGAQPATLWALARDVVRLGDELTFAALDAAAFEERLQASLARHYGRRAARVLQAPAQLVLDVWRARRHAADGPAAWLHAVTERAASLHGPLVYSGAALTAPPAGERALLERVAARVPVLHVVPDVAAALRDRPVLAAAWPEAGDDGAAGQRPIARRAAALRGVATPRPIELLGGRTLEATATAVAQRTLHWLAEGRASVALVALDRLTARRVRALLERADVLVADETGWKLSTTSAAAAVMRWLDLVRDDCYWRDLLDWLKSSFVLAQRADKADAVALIERAVRREGVLQGAGSARRALGAYREAPAFHGAQQVLALVEAERTSALRAAPTLAAQSAALMHALDTLGMRAGLEADPVGQAVLAELDTLARQFAARRTGATLAEMRALLAAHFEDAGYVDRAVESPVVMVSLAATALRRFDAALLIGADAAHLPSAADELLFMSNAVRAELGLPTLAEHLQAQTAQLASLLATTPDVAAAWTTCIGDEPNAVSPLLERLRFVTTVAHGDQLDTDGASARYAVVPQPPSAPRPAAAGLLPARISASQAQSLVDCPYQFYARALLGLRQPDDVVEAPDKRDFGLTLHEVLKRFHRAWGAADFSALPSAELAASLREHAAQTFAEAFARAPGMLAYERRFDALVPPYIDWLAQRARDGWRWQAAEVPLSRALDVDGHRVELAGRIDRLDTGPAGALGLIDYKARDAKTLKDLLRAPGEDVQLAFYGLLLPQPPAEAAYLAFERPTARGGGVVSVPAPDPGAAAAALGARLQHDLGRIAQGAALPAHGSRTVCGRCEMRGVCRRDHWESAP